MTGHQIGEISLMKEMTSTAMNMAEEEEEAEKTAAAAATTDATTTSDGVKHPTAAAVPDIKIPEPATATAADVTSAAGAHADTHVGTGPELSSALTSPGAVSPSPSGSSARPNGVSPTGTPSASHKHDATQRAKKKVKTPEQRKKEAEQEEERRKTMEARIVRLTDKLIERLRPYVEASKPGNSGDSETVAFENRMKREADDLKLESFGVEILHTIGTIYMMKGTSYLKSKQFLGMWVHFALVVVPSKS
jgi:hypothetical protein